MMSNTNRTLCSLLTTLFITLSSLTFVGCAKKIAIESLFASPNSYVGKRVEVYGDIYTIEIAGGGVVGKSIIIRISSPDETSVELLKCEFDRDSPPPPSLKEGDLVTIEGKVDIVEGTVFLRECKVVK